MSEQVTYRVTNVSDKSVGLVDIKEGVQLNLAPRQSILLTELTSQIINLTDPYKHILKLEVL